MHGNTESSGIKPDTPKKRRRLTVYDRDKRILLRCERAAQVGDSCEESSRGGPEEEFVDIVTKLITETLEITWRDRQAFTSVLKAAIGNHIQDLLADYLDFWVEEYSRYIVSQFKLDKDVKPDYTYANHAKLHPAIDTVKEKLQKMEIQLKELACRYGLGKDQANCDGKKE